MSVTHTVRSTAARAGDSRWLELLTRAGLVGYGLLHLVVAWLAAQIALGNPSAEGDQSGAFQLLEQQPMGRVVLVFLIVGLIAMALWQLILAAVGHKEEQGWHRPAERLVSLARTIVYAALAWTAIRVLRHAGVSVAAQQQEAAGSMLAKPAGQWLLGLAGLLILGIGVGLAIYGWKRKFQRNLRLDGLTAQMRKTVLRLGQAGYVAKGVAYAVAGVLVVQAALSEDAARARGLDAALHTVAGTPYGTLLLMLIAVGMAAFGVYCFVQSRYRKI